MPHLLRRLLATLLLFILAVPLATGCAETPEARGAQVAHVARLAYSTASVSVQELAELQADWMAAQTSQEAAQAAVEPARRMVAALDAARAALERVRPYVATGKGEATVLTELRAVLSQAELVLELLGAVGKSPPPEVREALGYLHGFLGDAS